jgi:hypothetical protein
MDDARPPQPGRRPPRRALRQRLRGLRPGTMIVLLALLTFDTLLLVVVGLILAIYMEHPAGLIFCAVCWLTAVLLQAAARGVDRAYRDGGD